MRYFELKVHPGMSYFTDQREHMCIPTGGIITAKFKEENAEHCRLKETV